jgi:O-acetylserine/cysteine efflux transporter
MRPRDMALACLVSVCWGLAFVAVPFGLRGFAPAQLTALRFTVAAIPVLFVPRPRIAWPMLALIGLTLFTGQFLLLFFGYTHGLPPGVASVTQQMHVFFTVVLAALFLRDVPRVNETIGLVVAFGGLALIGATVGGDLRLAGLLFGLGGAFSWAIGNVLVKRQGAIRMLPLMGWAALVPPLPSLLVEWAADPGAPSLSEAVLRAPASSILAVLYLGVVATNVGYVIWARLLTRYTAATVAPFALLAPCTGILASALVFGERFSPLRYAGMALILAGLACVVLVRPRRSAVAAPR